MHDASTFALMQTLHAGQENTAWIQNGQGSDHSPTHDRTARQTSDLTIADQNVSAFERSDVCLIAVDTAVHEVQLLGSFCHRCALVPLLLKPARRLTSSD